jgi:hypothetical protein
MKTIKLRHIHPPPSAFENGLVDPEPAHTTPHHTTQENSLADGFLRFATVMSISAPTRLTNLVPDNCRFENLLISVSLPS